MAGSSAIGALTVFLQRLRIETRVLAVSAAIRAMQRAAMRECSGIDESSPPAVPAVFRDDGTKS